MAYALIDAGPRPSGIPAALRAHATVLVTLLAVALVTRGLFLGDPAIGGDEQFYLLVGDRMWQGALPYVDIWDRKPIGLFLLYAALRPLSPDGILAYQIGALVFATLTAFVVTRIASRLVCLPAATAAGCLYLILLPTFGGVGGQSPVFYNLVMAMAGLLVVKAGEDESRAAQYALGAMALAGLAIQVKYTAFVEGIAFGGWLLVLRWRRGFGLRDVAARAAAWSLVAVVPTVAALLFYVAIGHGHDFVYANFTSIFRKHAPTSELGNIFANLILIGPTLVFAGFAFGWTAWRRHMLPLMWFLVLWTAAAICGYIIIGHFYTHYLLPSLVPLSIVCAVLLDNFLGLALVVAPAIVLYVGTTQFPSTERVAADHRKIDTLVAALSPYTKYGCVYISEGPMIAYLLTGSCLPTRFAFTEHLTHAAESASIDQPRELAAVLEAKPPAIVLKSIREPSYLSLDTDRMLRATLAADYRLRKRIETPKPNDALDVYTRNDLP